MEQKEYIHHTGWIGGLKRNLMKNLTKEDILKTAVFEMLPNNRTRKAVIKRLTFKN